MFPVKHRAAWGCLSSGECTFYLTYDKRASCSCPWIESLCLFGPRAQMPSGWHQPPIIRIRRRMFWHRHVALVVRSRSFDVLPKMRPLSQDLSEISFTTHMATKHLLIINLKTKTRGCMSLKFCNKDLVPTTSDKKWSFRCEKLYFIGHVNLKNGSVFETPTRRQALDFT